MSIKGFDCNCKLTKELCKKFLDQDYKVAIRYVGRNSIASHDLDKNELEIIIDSGLELGIVQHCPIPPWIPTTDLGIKWGRNAAVFAKQCGYSQGKFLCLDLEGVKKGTPKQDIIDYCNNWYNQVVSYGFEPAIYIGYDVWLSSNELYYNLKFKHYWAAYNVTIAPTARGYQIKQQLQKKVNGIYIDSDIITKDLLGVSPSFMGKIEELTLEKIINTVDTISDKQEWKNFFKSLEDIAKLSSDTGFIEKSKYLPIFIKEVAEFYKKGN